MLLYDDMFAFTCVNWPKGLRSFKHKTIHLSEEVVQYLMEDGIILNEFWRTGKEEDKKGRQFPDLEQLVKEILE